LCVETTFCWDGAAADGCRRTLRFVEYTLLTVIWFGYLFGTRLLTHLQFWFGVVTRGWTNDVGYGVVLLFTEDVGCSGIPTRSDRLLTIGVPHCPTAPHTPDYFDLKDGTADRTWHWSLQL